MYAVIDDSGVQYKVAEGEVVDVPLRDAQPGESVVFDRVLLLSTDQGATVGSPIVPDARVVAEVLDQTKGPKINILHFRRRKRYQRRQGHRQHYTRVRIKEIVVPARASAGVQA